MLEMRIKNHDDKKNPNIRFDKSYTLMTAMKTIGSITSFEIPIYKQIKALEYHQMYVYLIMHQDYVKLKFTFFS